MRKLFTLIFTVVIAAAYAQPYTIGHTTVTFNDPARTGGFGSGGGSGRQMQTEIYYPATSQGENTPLAQGQFPVIVFGHGFVMTWDVYNNLWENLVPKGYVMAFLRTEGSISPSHDDFGLDLRQVANKMQELNSNSNSIFYQALTNKTAIMGHSMGGGSTILAGANNANITTIIGLAPAETNPSAVAAAANVTVPALIFSGASDGVTPPADHHIPIYNALNSTCKYFINVVNGSHCYFANTSFTCDFGESSPGSLSRLEQQDIANDFLGQWLDYTLKSNSSSFSTFNDSLDASNRVTYLKSCVVSSTAGYHLDKASVFVKDGFLMLDIPIKDGELNLTVYDISGRLVINEFFKAKNDTKKVPVSALKTGVYIVNISSHDENFIKKIIVN